MDPQIRILLEVTYEALTDSGISVHDMRGSDTGVFIGLVGSEAGDVWSSNPHTLQGYHMTGCQTAMAANRLSYAFDFKGPSCSIDTACSSSLMALDHAISAIRTGTCQSAIVGGTHLCLKPQVSLQFMKLGMLSPEGACKAFDKSGNGYCRSEGIVAIYLQKAKYAKRVYATVLHTKSNADGSKEKGITYPSGKVQRNLLEQTYKELNILPERISYVEAHGTGTKAGDVEELGAIADVFCSNRAGPLLIGSVKSNMGHCEPTSGLAGIAKVICAMETQQLPGNLHYIIANPNIPALLDGRLKVVSQTQKWDGGLVGVNSFGFGGANVHAVLKHNDRNIIRHPSADKPRVFTASARTAQGLENLLDEIYEKYQGHIELQGLMKSDALTPLHSHPYRGYVLLNTDKVMEVKKCTKRPVWYIFSGMGTQWNGMGRDLMKIAMFHDSIMKSDAVLKSLGLELYDMLINGKGNDLNSVINSFVCISSIQVALVDVLRSMNIEPDGIVGHSVGELACGYASGSLTAEQVVLSAYWRGKCIQDANLAPGGMAVVGLTWDEAKHQCPHGVMPACHNSTDTVTISGDKESVHAFVEDMKTKGIFAKEVQTNGVAFHSSCMDSIAPVLKDTLDKVIKHPQLRSQKWISSSFPEEKWHYDVAKYASAEYYAHNLISPVLFQEALNHVPRNAVTIEISPHCLMQAVLKRSLGPQCELIGLMKRDHMNNLDFFLSNVGKLYTSGVDVDAMRLFPDVQFPVPRGTPMISPLLHWDHSQSWNVPSEQDFLASSGGTGQNCFPFEIDTSTNKYLLGHKIDQRVLFPATGFMVLAWHAVAKSKFKDIYEVPITLLDMHVHTAVILESEQVLNFEVDLITKTDQFLISENGNLVASGKYTVDPYKSTVSVERISERQASELEKLNEKDIYQELLLRGYEYDGEFKSIQSAHISCMDGNILWNGNWIPFMDAMLQMHVLASGGRGLLLPTRFQTVHIEPSMMPRLDHKKEHTIGYVEDSHTKTLVAGGVEMVGIHVTTAQRQQRPFPVILDGEHFVPYVHNGLDMTEIFLWEYVEALKLVLLNLLENTPKNKLTDELTLSLSGNSSSIVVSLENFRKEKDCVALHLLDSSQGRAVQKGTFGESLYSDKAFGYLLQNSHLRSCLDVAFENQSALQTSIKIVELELSVENNLSSFISPILSTSAELRADYTLVYSGIQQPNSGIVEKTLLWEEDKSAPADVKDVDIFVCNGITLADSKTVSKFYRLIEQMKIGSFVLLHETTHNLPLAKCLNLLNRGKTITDDSSLCFNYMQMAGFLKKNDFEIVMQHTDGLLSTLFLYRKLKLDVENNDLVIDIDCSYQQWIPHLQRLLKVESKQPIWLTSLENGLSGIVGLVKCLRKESDGDRIRCIFDTNPNDKKHLQDVKKQDMVMNIYQDGQYGSYRHIPLGKQERVETQYAYVGMLNRGNISSLRWFSSPLFHFKKSSPSDTLCNVHFASLNFRDVMLATGKLAPDAIPGNYNGHCMLGMEFSGHTSSGKRVMGLVPTNGLATMVVADSQYLWEVPESWSMQEAATVPAVYSTVYYALVVRAQIIKGDIVLIHSGTGGLGQAAIFVALHYGCDVFTTVGNDEKREYLLKRFSKLNPEHIFSSRDTSFESHIMKATKGKGVNVVLNSLAEEKLQASLRLVSLHGRFLELGKVDMSQNTNLGMSIFLRNVTFHGILLDSLFDNGNSEWPKVADLVRKGIESSVITPLDTTIFEKEDVESAFRYMAQGKHKGKVLLKIREDSSINVNILAVPRFYCDPTKSYIITGGLGGVGLELANWLVERGAMKLILTSRIGIGNGYQVRQIKRWRKNGIDIRISREDISTIVGTEQLIKDSAQIGGIFHLAMVIQDALFQNQDTDSFQVVEKSKVIGTSNLDIVTRKMFPTCLFVVFSSMVGVLGNIGQSNYGWANSAMDRICVKRKKDGFHGLAIQFGPIRDVGVAHNKYGTDDSVVIANTKPQSIASCLASLDTILTQSHPVVGNYILATTVKRRQESSNEANLVDIVAKVLGIDEISMVSDDSTLTELGLDSLMEVEIKQRFKGLTAQLLDYSVGMLTIGQLKDMSASVNSAQHNSQRRRSRRQSINIMPQSP